MNSNKLLKIIILASFCVLIYTGFRKNDLPDSAEINELLYKSPLQTSASIAPFEIKRGSLVYKIEPLYDYELFGLVVSCHDTKTWWDYYHKEWRDYINIKDIGVVWGENIKNEIYKKINFTSGSWTLYCDFKEGTDETDWQNFRNDCVSNNHLICDDSGTAKTIKSVRSGDQVYLRGYLVKYSHSGNLFKRETSTNRTDRGCETIFVTDFRILKRSNIFLHAFHRVSLYLIIICMTILLIKFVKSLLEP